ncbi:MAG: hypothetical protein ACRC20_05680 [Segniliparus sp.]|uniref:hypothetical protein n=1 Tax=Segniliparus sp. TaxID=2804064 RepID=UPI003F3AA1D8
MAEFDLNTLRAWKPETVIAAAGEAGQRTAAFEGIVDEVKALTNETAGRSSGSGEEARFAHVDKTVAFAHEKIQLMHEHQQIVQEAGYDLTAKHNRLFTAVQAAQQTGLVVNSIGTVEGDYPRQSQELIDKHATSVGQAKHELELADAEHARKIRDSNARIKEGAENGFRKADSIQRFGNFKDDPVDPKKRQAFGVIGDKKDKPVNPKQEPEPPPPGPGGRSMNDWLKLPHYNARSLDDTETRTVYLRGEGQVAALNEQWKQEGLSAEERARRTFDLRNSLRTYCRDLMVDQAARAKLDEGSPNMTWEQMMQKEAAKGNTGDNAYEQIAQSAARSRDSVNKSLGIDPNNPPPLPQAKETPSGKSEPESVPRGEPRPSEPGGGRMRPQIEGEGPSGRMRPRIEGEVVPPGAIAGQQGEQRRGE